MFPLLDIVLFLPSGKVVLYDRRIPTKQGKKKPERIDGSCQLPFFFRCELSASRHTLSLVAVHGLVTVGTAHRGNRPSIISNGMLLREVARRRVH